MSYELNGTQSLYSELKLSGASPEDEAKRKEMEKMKNESMDTMLWAQSQNMAMNKVRLYHTLAKEIYGQQ